MVVNRTKSLWLKSGLYVLITVTYIYAAFRFGIPLAVKIAETVGKDKANLDAEETNIILPPRLNYLPTATNSAELTVSGTAPANQTVAIFLNDLKEAETPADAEGYFEKNIVLNLGGNQIYAVTLDPSGNVSANSNQMTTSFLDIAPDLTVSEPVDGVELKQKEEYTLVKGQTEAGVTLKVNNRLGVVNSDGTFSYRLGLSQGENKIVVEAIDEAGNVKKVELSVTFKKR